jgi:exodeoxyribonuclease VII large subunit
MNNLLDLIADSTLTVSAAVALINGVLTPLSLNIEGEVSGFKISQDKFVFFDIKDENAILNCFMMRFSLPFKLEDGMKIKLTGYAKVRPQSGKISLTVQAIELVGEGALQKAYEELKAKLQAEGLFEPTNKKSLPFLPKSIAIITSKSGDALQDILRILKNRSGGLKLKLIPVSVQGQSAVKEIVGALDYVNKHLAADLVILARGGGSLEDLQAFNSEPVVRAVFGSKSPIITGVGHEPDITLVDLVADVRAATPTNAAEIAVPDYDQVLFDLDQTNNRLRRGIDGLIKTKFHQLDIIAHQLKQSLQAPARGIDLLHRRMMNMLKSMQNLVWENKSLLESSAASLAAINPENILKRGYSIATNADGKIIHSVNDVALGDVFTTKLSNGLITSKINNINK